MHPFELLIQKFNKYFFHVKSCTNDFRCEKSMKRERIALSKKNKKRINHSETRNNHSIEYDSVISSSYLYTKRTGPTKAPLVSTFSVAG
jgi:hypothetical protein